jgi:hypothetical protein
VALSAKKIGDNPRAAERAAYEPFHSQLSPRALIGQSDFEFISDTAPGEAGGTLSRDDDKIGGRWKHDTAPTEKLSNLALDSIANDRIADFAADSDPQSGLILVIRPADDNEICRLNFAAGARQSQEFRALSQASRFREPLRAF